MTLLEPRYRPGEVVEMIDGALVERRPFCLLRLIFGDFFLQVMGAMLKDLRVWAHYRMDPEDEALAGRLAAGIGRADVVGMPYMADRGRRWAEVWYQSVRLAGYEPAELPTVDMHISYLLVMCYDFFRWADRRIIVVNEDAKALAARLRAGEYAPLIYDYNPRPLNVVGAVGIGEYETDAVVERALEHDFDLALLGVGMRKLIIGPELARRSGKVVLDMGHMLNAFVLDVKPANRKVDPMEWARWDCTRPYEFMLARELVASNNEGQGGL